MRRMSIVLGIGLIALWSGSSLAISPVNLGTASAFAILAGSAVTNTGFSLITGDLGESPSSTLTGFPPGTLIGTQHLADGVALQAENDLVTAYNDAAGRTPVTTVATELGGTTLTPGVYNSASGTFGITGTLTLDAQADPNGVFIFQMETTLITASSSEVRLIRGAQACNVFWQVGSSATLGTNSAFNGNILALTSITLTTGAKMGGRVLARNGAVTLDTDTLTAAICACIPDNQVTLVPNDPNFPAQQNVHACAHLLATANTQVIVPVFVSQNVPTVTITSGCPDCGDPGCEPLGDWVLGDWTFVANPPEYVANLSAAAGVAGCCVCLHLDFVLPVELLSFEGLPGDNTVNLAWTTASETSTAHFEIVRDGQSVANVPATNSATGSSYHWTDVSVLNGTVYRYDLVAVSLGGVRQLLRTVAVTPSVTAGEVTEYALRQNYPNPFNPSTTITFTLPEAAQVRLTVFDLVGREVAVLANGNRAAGTYSVKFDAAHLAGGVYFYRLDAGSQSAVRKLVLMK